MISAAKCFSDSAVFQTREHHPCTHKDMPLHSAWWLAYTVRGLAKSCSTRQSALLKDPRNTSLFTPVLTRSQTKSGWNVNRVTFHCRPQWHAVPWDTSWLQTATQCYELPLSYQIDFIFGQALCEQKKRKKKKRFTLFSDHNGSLPRRRTQRLMWASGMFLTKLWQA